MLLGVLSSPCATLGGGLGIFQFVTEGLTFGRSHAKTATTEHLTYIFLSISKQITNLWKNCGKPSHSNVRMLVWKG